MNKNIKAFIFLGLVGWLLFLPTKTLAQSDSIPANVRQQMTLFLKALNSGQTAELEKFIRGSHHPKVLEQVPMDSMLARWLTVHQQTGAVEARIFKSLFANNCHRLDTRKGDKSLGWLSVFFRQRCPALHFGNRQRQRTDAAC